MVTLNIHTHTLTHLFLPMSREACEVSCTHAFSLSGSQQKEVSGIVRHTCTHSLTDSWQPVLFCPCSCPLQAPSSLSLAAFLLADTHTVGWQQVWSTLVHTQKHNTQSRVGISWELPYKTKWSSRPQYHNSQAPSRPAGQFTYWLVGDSGFWGIQCGFHHVLLFLVLQWPISLPVQLL